MVGIAVAAIGLGISIYQGVKAAKQRNEAKEAIENYERQDLVNPYLALDKYPTEAIALQKEANARELATNVSIAAQAGRGLSIMPQASATFNRRSRELYGEIEKYTLEREKLIAGGEMDKQGMQERREEADIGGLSNLYATADQNLNNAIVSGGNALAIGAEAFGGKSGGEDGEKSGGGLFGDRDARIERKADRQLRKNQDISYGDNLSGDVYGGGSSQISYA